MSNALIPTNGVHITETQYPKGFQVASYDAEGFCTAPRWFPTRAQAEAHAAAKRCAQGDRHFLSSAQ